MIEGLAKAVHVPALHEVVPNSSTCGGSNCTRGTSSGRCSCLSSRSRSPSQRRAAGPPARAAAQLGTAGAGARRWRRRQHADRQHADVDRSTGSRTFSSQREHMIRQLPRVRLVSSTGCHDILLLSRTAAAKLRLLATAGAGCQAAGLAWSLGLPILKLLGTSSFVLVTGGWSFLAPGLFYWMVDVRGWRR
jgi:hypothetical protein